MHYVGQNDIIAWGVSKDDATCERGELSDQKRKTLSCVNWLFAQTKHVDEAPEILHAGYHPGISYIF